MDLKSVIVSFLWSTVRCLVRTDHNKKVKPPVSHAPISNETVFRIIHFILAYAEIIIKRFSKGVIYLLCCMFLLQYCKATTTVIHAQDYNRNQSLPAFAQRNSFVSVFNKVENTVLPQKPIDWHVRFWL